MAMSTALTIPEQTPGRQFGQGIRFNGSCYQETSHSGASVIRKQMRNWIPSRATADADLLPDQALLVARSRDLDRNNGVAAGSFQTLQDNTVGLGLRLASSPDYRALGKDITWAEQWSRNVESLWRSWAETTSCDVAGKLNFASMTQLVFRSVLENGEALALPLWMERNTTPFRTCLQLIESDRLSNPNMTIASINLRGGVQMDDFGKPITYYIQKLMSWPGFFFPSLEWQWEAIPAETAFGRKRVLHMYTQDRPDQTRGKPILTPVIEQFRMLDAYQRTELQSAIANSLVAGVIETPLDPAAIAEMMGGDPNCYLATKGEYRVQLEGGTMFPLYPGDKMTPFIPGRPSAQYAAFCEHVLRQIGTSVGLPYELILKDFSKTNYSSARAALNEAWRFFSNRRAWMGFYWASAVYKLWFEEAVNAGMIEAPDFYALAPFYLRAKWIGPPRGQIDPVKEAEAAQIRMNSFISTLEDECAEQGQDYNDVLDQRALEIARMKELDLYVAPPPPLAMGSPAEPEETPVREKV
jgi:lambda family phage portal protein